MSPQSHSFLRSSRCSKWRACLFCYTRSVIPQAWLLLPPVTPLRYSLRSYIFLKGATAIKGFARLRSFVLLWFVTFFAAHFSCCQSSVQLSLHKFHFALSHSFCQPHASAVGHSLLSFHLQSSFSGIMPFPTLAPCAFTLCRK